MEKQYKHAFNYETPKASRFVRGLWQISGGDKLLLQRATFSDQVKYACLGGVILATGGMAALSGGYAFFTIFSTGQDESNIPMYVYAIAVFFGLIWGLIIFNIDRFIVTSTGKGDGTERITMDEFKSAIPRIILGLIIAITVSKPLEIRMFKPEIDIKLIEVTDSIAKVQMAHERDNMKLNYLHDYQNLDNAIKGRDSIQLLINQKDKDILDNMTGRKGKGPGIGSQVKFLNSQKTQLEAELKEYNNNFITPFQAKVNSIENEINEEIEQKKEAILSNKGGLSQRISALEDVAPITSWMVTLLFVAVELTPIFFKLMLIKTPYDYLAENRDDLIRAENGIEVVYDIVEDENGGVKENHHTINHDAELAIFTKNKLSEVKKYLTSYALIKYTEDKKREIEQNPETVQ